MLTEDAFLAEEPVEDTRAVEVLVMDGPITSLEMVLVALGIELTDASADPTVVWLVVEL